MSMEVQKHVDVLTTSNGTKYINILDLVGLLGQVKGNASYDKLREALIALLVDSKEESAK